MIDTVYYKSGTNDNNFEEIRGYTKVIYGTVFTIYSFPGKTIRINSSTIAQIVSCKDPEVTYENHK